LQASSAGIGKGCEFRIILPAIADSSPNKMKTDLEHIQPSGRSLHVLIVEDNVDAGDALSMLLRLHRHDVHVARTGPTAIEMVKMLRPDVVLLDIALPDMDGYQVAKQLRALPDFKNVLICALTGYTPSEADRQRQKETGFDHYYVKPIELAKLIELFKTVMPATT
jgi:CheY-like chemotaxis protein